MSTRSGVEPPATPKAAPASKPVAKPRALAAAEADAAAKAAPTRKARANSIARPAAEPDAPAAAPAREHEDAQNEAEGVQLCFLRHADAGDPAAWPGDDAARPLSAKGRRQAKRLASFLADLGWRPHVVLTSPKLRANQTAKAVGRALGVQPREDERLGEPFGAALITDLLREHADARRILLVGHDPEFSTLTSLLVGATIEVRKGAFVRLDLPDRAPKPGTAMLRWLLPPGAVPG